VEKRNGTVKGWGVPRQTLVELKADTKKVEAKDLQSIKNGTLPA
jgi:hypothetical protein